MNILIIGPQGSGKAGDFLRDLAKTNENINKLIDKGILLEDNYMFGLMSRYIGKEVPQRDNIVFDGYPRSIKQYSLLKEWFEKKDTNIDH